MAMNPALGETIHYDFVVSNASGAAANADSTPSIQVFEDATDVSIVATTVTNRTVASVLQPGHYRFSIACTTLNGFEVGKSYNVIAQATVGGIAAKAKIDSFQIRFGSVDAVNVTRVNGTAATVVPSPVPASLDVTERTAIAVAVLTTTGSDTVANSLGKRTADIFAALAEFRGLQLIGVVSSATTIAANAFSVTLASPVGAGASAADMIGLWATLRSGNRQPDGRQISTATFTSTTGLTLGFGIAFASVPAAGDAVSISM